MNTVDDRLDNVFDKIDRLLLEGLFDLVDNILQYHIVGGSETDILIGYLVITLTAKDKLKNRESFMDKVKKEITIREPDRVHTLLRGLD